MWGQGHSVTLTQMLYFLLRNSLNIYKFLIVNPIIILHQLKVVIETYKLQILDSSLAGAMGVHGVIC